MSRVITNNTKTVNITTESRTWKTEIYSVLNDIPVVVFHREYITKIDNELTARNYSSEPLRLMVNENLNRQITADGVTVTVSQMRSLISRLADELEEEQAQKNVGE